MKSQLNEKIILSDAQKEVLYGALLGDGSLVVHKGGINAYFSYLSKSQQHVEYVVNYFAPYLTQAKIYNSDCFDRRTNKIYHRSSARTYSNEAFTNEYNKWYRSGVKIIPSDLKLTSLTCLIWYIGDGCISHSKNTQYIKLATQCFSKEDQEEILIPQLQEFEAHLVKADISKDGEQQYFIYIPRRKIKKFLDYIGPCPFSDYQYKWDYKEYKNFSLSQNPEFIQNIIKLFRNGISSGTIAKYLDVDRSTVVKYLKLNGFNPSENLHSKKKVGDIYEEE